MKVKGNALALAALAVYFSAGITFSSNAIAQAYKFTDLGSLGGSSYGLAINNAGQVAGYSYFAGNTSWHAVSWTDNSLADLGTLPGGLNSVAFGINDLGQVAGTSYDHNNNIEKAVLWNSLTPKELPARYAYGINNAGQVVGDR